jgi:pyruvate,water dikinase
MVARTGVVTEADLADPGEVGNKFAVLARLRSAGYRVPAFFCIGSSAYRAAVSGDADARLPEQLRQDVGGRLRLLRSADVAVRSCFVVAEPHAGEDSAVNPMAGMSETVLRVRGAGDVAAAVEHCWAGARASRVAVYLDEFGMSGDSLAVAVAVQEMVDVRSAFVAFSADPVAGTDNVVVAAAHGLGEGLVQERSDAHHYVVDPSDTVDDRTVVDRTVVGADNPPLSTREVQDIADLARRVAAELGQPQDIEGAIDLDGVLWLLQSRPVVTRDDRLRVFTNLNISESFPGLSSPMTFSVASRFYRVCFGDNYRRFGVPQASLARESDALATMLAYIDGRVFYDITSFYRLHSLSPFFPLVRASWEKKVGIADTRRSVGQQDGASGGRTGVLAFARMTATALRAVLANGRRMRSFESYWARRLPAAQREFEQLRWPMERIDHYRALWGEVSTWWGVTLVNDTVANSLYGICRALLRPIAAGNADGVLADLLSPPDPTLVEDFWRACRHAVPAEEAAASERRLADLIAARGDICLTGLKVEEPSLGERLSWLRVNAHAQADREPDRSTVTRNPVPGRLVPRLRWLLAVRLARRLRRLIAHRENHRYLRSQLFAYCRKFALSIAPDLRRAHAITDLSDIWFLTDTEAIGALSGHAVDQKLTAVVRMRQDAVARYGAVEPPAEFQAVGAVPERRWREKPHPAADHGTIEGIGSSAGVVRGRAMIVTSPLDTKGVGRHTIVIARTTDPGWIGVMSAAGGLVVERGSMLSHTAITGRLLGLPTVVCARDASTLIPDGALVEVDGGAGVVRIIDETSESREG